MIAVPDNTGFMPDYQRFMDETPLFEKSLSESKSKGHELDFSFLAKASSSQAVLDICQVA